MTTVEVLIGNCRDVLRTLPEASVHCVITSPPFWALRDYGLPPSVWGGDEACEHDWGDELITRHRGKVGSRSTLQGGLQSGGDGRLQEVRQGQLCRRCGAWLGCLGLEPTPELFTQHLVEVFREVRRVLRDDGVLWLNLGDTYSQNTKWGGKSGKKNYASVLGGYQRVRNLRTNSGLKPKDLAGIPWRVALALRKDGWWLRSAAPWIKDNAMPESVKDRPTVAHENWFLLSKARRYFYDHRAVLKPFADARQGNDGSGIDPSANGGRNRRTTDFFYESLDALIGRQKAWLAHLEHVRENGGMLTDQDGDPLGLLFPTEGFKGHFATFSSRLIEPMIRAGTSKKGRCPGCGAPWKRDEDRRKEWAPTCKCGIEETEPCVVLDPFGGAGTTGLVAAARLGRDAILIELNPKNVELTRRRIESEAPLFVDVIVRDERTKGITV